MGNFAFLTGCPDRGAAERYDMKQIWADPGPELLAKYAIPLFWLAGFDAKDAVTTHWPVDARPDERAELMLLCAPVRDFVARLETRRAAVLALLPAESYALYYDEWIRFVRSRYPRTLLLRTEDIFSMGGYPESAQRLLAALRAMAAPDSGKAIGDRGALDWFAGFEGLCAERASGESAEAAAARWRAQLAGSGYTESGTLIWPTRPQPPELALAQSAPEAAPPAEAGSAATQNAALTTAIREGRRPTDLGSRMQLAVDKFTGDAPLGVDAPDKSVRKWIAGGGALLDVLRNGFFGLLFTLIGAGTLFFGLSPEFKERLVAVGAVMLPAGLFFSWRCLRAIGRLMAAIRA